MCLVPFGQIGQGPLCLCASPLPEIGLAMIGFGVESEDFPIGGAYFDEIVEVPLVGFCLICDDGASSRP